MDDLIFNPAQEDNCKWVSKLIETYPDKQSFQAGEPYEVSDDGKLLELYPTYSLIKANRVVADIDWHQPDYQKYFVVHNRIMGEGAFGEVRSIKARWQITPSQLLYKGKSNKLYKTCHFYKKREPFQSEYTWLDAGPSDVHNEMNMLSRVPYFKIKYELVRQKGALGIIMAKVGFINLNRWIKQWQRRPQIMSTNQAIALAIDLIDEVKRLHDRFQIIHADIKPANTRLEVIRGQLKPRLIDFGFSCDINRLVADIRGNVGYLDPMNHMELSDRVDKRSDEYSTVISILELFGFKSYLVYYDSGMTQYPKLDFSKLFRHQEDLSSPHRHMLKNAFRRATRVDREKRADINIVREALQTVLISRLMDVSIDDFDLKLYQFGLEYPLTMIDKMEKLFVDELLRDYEAMLALDELIKFHQIDQFLPMPLKDIIVDFLKNQHRCTDIYLYVQDELYQQVDRIIQRSELPSGLPHMAVTTRSMMAEPKPIGAAHLKVICHRAIFVRDSLTMMDHRTQALDRHASGLENQSLFSRRAIRELAIHTKLDTDAVKMDRPVANQL